MNPTVLRYPQGYQFLDGGGSPLALGYLNFYAAGTTTPRDTYSDAQGLVANANPVLLDGSGKLTADVFLGGAGPYKEVLYTAGGATVSPWPVDNIPCAWQADWNATSGPAAILHKPSLAAVATSGAYGDLTGTPAASTPFTGDSGSGGVAGLVPAPAAGDAASGKVLGAGGAWVAGQGVTGAYGGTFKMAVLEDLVTLSGATTNASITIPAGALVVGCSALVNTTITGSGVTAWKLGYTGSDSAFGSGLGLAAGQTNVGNIGGQAFYAPTNIVFTATGGSFSDGVVRLMLSYLQITVPTS
jgi:hypothetical protein